MDCICNERNIAGTTLLSRRRVDIFQLLVSLFTFPYLRKTNQPNPLQVLGGLVPTELIYVRFYLDVPDAL